MEIQVSLSPPPASFCLLNISCCRSIESLIAETEANLTRNRLSAPAQNPGSARMPFMPVPSRTANAPGVAAGKSSEHHLRREVANIQNHVRMELEEKIVERCRDMEQHFNHQISKHAQEVSRQLAEYKRDAATGGGRGGRNEWEEPRDAEIEDKFARDRNEMRKEIRTAQATAFSQMSDLETNLKRQMHQFENQTRELRGQVLESQRTTKEQVEEVDRQNNTLLGQLKRAVGEHVRASDEHAAAAKRVESEMQTLTSKVRRMDRGYDSLEARLQDAAGRGGSAPVSREVRIGGGAPDMGETRAAIDAVQRQLTAALDTEKRQNEGKIQALKDLVQNKLELATTRTQVACEKLARGAEDSISKETADRGELSREVRDVMAKFASFTEQQEAAVSVVRRQSTETAAQLAEQAKQMEEAERTQLSQQRLASLRLEEELTQRITSQTAVQIAALATQVDKVGRAGPSSQSPSRQAGDRATAQTERFMDRLESAEREHAKLKREVHDMNDSLYTVEQERKGAASFEERQQTLNSKFQDMVSVCNDMLQASEERIKSEFATHAGEHNVSRHEVGEMAKALKQLEILVQIQRADTEQILHEIPGGVVRVTPSLRAITRQHTPTNRFAVLPD